MSTKRPKKLDSLLKFVVAMKVKIALQSKRFELEPIQMKMQMKFDTLRYRQQLCDMNVPKAEIERSFPLIITDCNEKDATNAASTAKISGAAANSNLVFPPLKRKKKVMIALSLVLILKEYLTFQLTLCLSPLDHILITFIVSLCTIIVVVIPRCKTFIIIIFPIT
jgi:hypothetical protein